MKLKMLVIAMGLPLALSAGYLQAQETEDDLDVTMSVLEEGETPDAALEPIALPEDASETAVESSAAGLATANAAREDGRAFGASRAEEARQRGAEAREQGRERADEALGNARDRVKDNIGGGALGNVPDNVRDNIPTDVQDRIPDVGSNIPDNVPAGPPGA